MLVEGSRGATVLGKSLNVVVVVAVLAIPCAVSAQITIQPTPPPDVVADSEPWFQAREPIMFAGNVYYPAGTQVHFNRNEMARTGYYGKVPLYNRTTLEPYSIVFVPLAGGMMQPYERRRTGEIAGTVGSTTPSFPIVSPAEAAASGQLPSIPQSPGPATSMSPAYVIDAPRPVATIGDSQPAPSGRTYFVTAEKPEGLNGIFVEYGGQRWFSSGPAVTLDSSRFARVGSLRNIPVYVDRDKRDTIYVAVAESVGGLVAPYSIRPLPNR
jgi:hypothetical protein